MDLKQIFFCLTCILLLSSCSLIQRQKIECYHSNRSIEQSIGFCSAIKSGNRLYVSGIAASGAMPSAIKSVYDQLAAVLDANGLSLKNVVKETVFTTDIDSFIKHQNQRKIYYGNKFPASSWVQVERLYLADYVLEVELVATYSE